MVIRRLRVEQVRRAALGASGLLRARPQGSVDARHYRRVMRQLDVVQLDSVNVVTRAHELPFFSRLGSGVDTEQLRKWLWTSREVHECWAHVASLMPTDAYPLLHHRRTENEHPWKSIQRLYERDPGYVDAVLDEVARDGPLAINQLSIRGDRTEGMWGWSPGKQALHWLFESGRLAVHERTTSFLARYDVPERVLPRTAVDAPPLPRDQAQEALILRAAAAQAVGTAQDLADHHRVPIVEARDAIRRLVDRGDLVEVVVDTWDRPAFALPDLAIPRSAARARALLVPFDPLVWFRPRVSRLFGFDYTIEIYVPAAQRRYGYYVLPFLLGDRLVARVDLKADRKAGRLLVRGSWAEPGVDRIQVAGELADELRELATWLELTGDIEVAANGDLARMLARVAG